MHVRSEKKEAAIKATIEDGRYFGASRQDTVLRLREKINMFRNEADEMIKNTGSRVILSA